jgi:hypothetical protein
MSARISVATRNQKNSYMVAIAHVMIAFRSAAGQVAARMVLWQQQEIQLDLEYTAMMALDRA